MLDLRKLRHAIAIAREGSYALAAERIHVSQSSLTRSIQALEREYAISIFNRGKYGAKLTHDGASFIRIAEDILRRTEFAREELHVTRGSEQEPVKFGMGSTSASTFLPKLLPPILADGTRLSIRLASNSALRLLLRRREISFFIGGLSRDENSYAWANDFHIQKIKGGRMSLLVREGHPLLSRDASPGALAAYPVAAGTFISDTLAPGTLEGWGLNQPSLELDDYDVLAAVVQQTDHILVSNHVFATARPEFHLVALPVRIGADFGDWGVVSCDDAEMTAPTQRVRAILMREITLSIAKAAGEA